MSNNENTSVYDDPSWQAYMNQAVAMSGDELDEAIDTAYEKNRAHIDALKNADIPEEIIDDVEMLNESVHNSAHSAALTLPEQNIADSVKRTRFAALKSLGSALKQALITVRMCAVTTYDFIITPVQKIDIAINKSDAKAYKKAISQLENKLLKEKDKINEKALVRLRKINLKNMRDGKTTYDESMLPYTSAEQEKLDTIVKRLRNMRQKLAYTQNEIDRCERRLISRKNFIEHDRQALMETKQSVHSAKDVSPATNTENSAKKHENKEKTSPVRKKSEPPKQNKRLSQEEYAAIKAHHLSDAQFKTAILLVKNFPDIGLENYLTHDIPVNKMPFLAKTYAELKDNVEFDALKSLNISEVSSLARGLKEGVITREEAVEAVGSFLELKAQVEKPQMSDTEIEKPDVLAGKDEAEVKEEPDELLTERVEDSVVIDLDDQDKSLDDEIKKANIAAAENRSKKNKDMVTEVFKTISDELPNGSSIEFEVNGEMYKAVRNESGALSYKAYDWETSYYEHISKPRLMTTVLHHAKEFSDSVNAQFNREPEVVRDL